MKSSGATHVMRYRPCFTINRTSERTAKEAERVQIIVPGLSQSTSFFVVVEKEAEVDRISISISCLSVHSIP